MVINEWTPAHAEAIYLTLWDSNLKQVQIAKNLNAHQSGIAKRLKVAYWREIEKTIEYIAEEITLSE